MSSRVLRLILSSFSRQGEHDVMLPPRPSRRFRELFEILEILELYFCYLSSLSNFVVCSVSDGAKFVVQRLLCLFLGMFY